MQAWIMQVFKQVPFIFVKSTSMSFGVWVSYICEIKHLCLWECEWAGLRFSSPSGIRLRSLAIANAISESRTGYGILVRKNSRGLVGFASNSAWIRSHSAQFFGLQNSNYLFGPFTLCILFITDIIWLRLVVMSTNKMFRKIILKIYIKHDQFLKIKTTLRSLPLSIL